MTTKRLTYKSSRKPQVENRDGKLVLSVSVLDLKYHWGKVTEQLIYGNVDVIEVWCRKRPMLHIAPSPPPPPPPPPEPPPPPVRLQVGEFKLK